MKTWTKTKTQGIYRRNSSGEYYSRRFSGGKEQWENLETTVYEVAKKRLADKRASEPTEAKPSRSGRMTMAEAIQILERDIDSGKPLRKLRAGRTADSSRHYRRQTIDALKRSWREVHGKDLGECEVRRITTAEVEQWAETFRTGYSGTRFNNTLGTLRRLFEIAKAKGETVRNPGSAIERETVRPREAPLPDLATFGRLVATIRNGKSRYAHDTADLVELLAYTGARIGELRAVEWRDLNLESGTLRLRKTKGGENAKPRTLHLIPPAKALLDQMRAKRPDEPPETPILRVGEARGSIAAAAKELGIERLRHHDLRHQFATVCLQNKVDVATVASWLGHKDGGKLLLSTYCEIIDEHSKAEAARVTFTPAAAAA